MMGASMRLRFAIPVPDALMAMMFALAAVLDFLTPEQLAALPPGLFEYRQELLFALLVEGGFLLMQGTLVDIATRLKKRPPVWAIVIIVAAVVLFSREALQVLHYAWGRGTAVFIPLLVSLAQRGRMLWTMPDRSRVEKLAARALIGNRITTGLALFGLMTLIMIIGVVFHTWDWDLLGAWPVLVAGAVYFAIAAYDEWRVRTPKFAERPRVLFGFDPLGVKYLEPL